MLAMLEPQDRAEFARVCDFAIDDPTAKKVAQGLIDAAATDPSEVGLTVDAISLWGASLAETRKTRWKQMTWGEVAALTSATRERPTE
jgi:fermentation-respiration switch protein FrsA (DUF1100 family)